MSCFVIAEAGVNHNGSAAMAMELVDAAAEAGANAVKFQAFRADAVVRRGAPKAAYQQRTTGAGDQFDMLQQLELTTEEFLTISRRCGDRGIEFLATPFDEVSAQGLVAAGVRRLKVASGEVTNIWFLRSLTQFGLPMFLSTGMATLEEVEIAVSAITHGYRAAGATQPIAQMLTLLQCTSNYPTRPEDVNLNAMATMRHAFDLPVGLSDHTEGVAIPWAAVALGAIVIEKHFTLDRRLSGPDHTASLEPGDFAAMVAGIRDIESALGNGVKRPADSELPVRDIVRRGIVLRHSLSKGTVISRDDIVLLRPQVGIPAQHAEDVVGGRLVRDMAGGSALEWADIAL